MRNGNGDGFQLVIERNVVLRELREIHGVNAGAVGADELALFKQREVCQRLTDAAGHGNVLFQHDELALFTRFTQDGV